MSKKWTERVLDNKVLYSWCFVRAFVPIAVVQLSGWVASLCWLLCFSRWFDMQNATDLETSWTTSSPASKEGSRRLGAVYSLLLASLLRVSSFTVPSNSVVWWSSSPRYLERSHNPHRQIWLWSCTSLYTITFAVLTFPCIQKELFVVSQICVANEVNGQNVS